MGNIRLAALVFLLPLITACSMESGGRLTGEKNIADRYVEAWQDFYPTRAYGSGMKAAVSGFEDYSAASVAAWIDFNRIVLKDLENGSEGLPLEERIDRRLLGTRVRSELLRWEGDVPHRRSPALYAGSLSRAVSRVLREPGLMPGEKVRLVRARLEGISSMCAAGRAQLEDGPPSATAQACRTLERAAEDIAGLPDRDTLPESLKKRKDFVDACASASDDMNRLAAFIRESVLPRVSLSDSPVLGLERYARRLQIYTDSDLTPESLEEMALAEIRTVRALMAELSAAYLAQAYPDRAVPADFGDVVGRALADMEENRPRTEAEYLIRLREFAADAERFVRERKIATLPDHQTLSLELAPESAGPMARIGYVSPPPPFHPNPWTTWFLATIPDSFPEGDREDFWRSFNFHFKRFIVIHELFPGHYLQTKITRESPHTVRILFPYGPYSEGWATLCERVALEAGWADGDPLTRLAQLRKRLENANRAYTSVQAHCRGWNEEKVLEFSIETSLLAPQFAKSLWGRLMRSPLQMTSYFLGSRMFNEVFDGEKRRLGDRFQTLRFMDTILRAGPIPIDAFPEVFRNFDD